MMRVVLQSKIVHYIFFFNTCYNTCPLLVFSSFLPEQREQIIRVQYWHTNDPSSQLNKHHEN